MPIVRALLLSVFLSQSLVAQRWADVIPQGGRIRVQTHKEVERYEGQFRSVAGDSLRMLAYRDLYADSIPVSLALNTLASVDLSTGYSRLSRGVGGFFIGGMGGAAIGALFGHIAYGCKTNCNRGDSGAGIAEAVFGVLGAGAGSLLGVAIGAVGAPEQWQNVYVDRRLQPSP